jgi:hypothetical protein
MTGTFYVAPEARGTRTGVVQSDLSIRIRGYADAFSLTLPKSEEV